MKQTNQILIFVGITIIGVVILFLIFSSNGKKFDWKETYNSESEEPYGSRIIHSLLKESNKEFDFMTFESEKIFTRLTFTRKNSTYVYVGKNFNPKPVHIDKLIFFAEKGNQVFISSNEFPKYLINKLEGGPPDTRYYSYVYNSRYLSAAVNLTKDEFHFKRNQVFYYSVKNKHKYYPWSYFYFETKEASELGTLNDYKNFIRYKVGKGYVYLHSTPILFSNIILTKERGFEYASRVFAHLEKGDIYWDEGTKKANRSQQISDNKTRGNSPLSWFLSQESFRYSWYLLLLTGLLYLIFRAKRRTPPIPVIAAKTDTSLLFARLVGKLYLKEGNHRNLALHKTKHFHLFIRRRYKIAKPELNDYTVNLLAEKSGLSHFIVRRIFVESENIKSSKEIGENKLTEYHNLLYMFYLNCK